MGFLTLIKTYFSGINAKKLEFGWGQLKKKEEE